jgi:hypothetical protein
VTVELWEESGKVELCKDSGTVELCEESGTEVLFEESGKWVLCASGGASENCCSMYLLALPVCSDHVAGDCVLGGLLLQELGIMAVMLGHNTCDNCLGGLLFREVGSCPYLECSCVGGGELHLEQGQGPCCSHRPDTSSPLSCWSNQLPLSGRQSPGLPSVAQ